MTLRYVEGFEGWNNPETYFLQGAGGSFFVDLTGGRFGGHALANSAGGGGESVLLTHLYADVPLLPFEQAAVLGFAYKFTPAGKQTLIMQWKDLHPVNGLIDQMELGKNANDTLYVASNGTVLARGTHPMLPNRYYYIEWKAYIKCTITDLGTGHFQGNVAGAAAHANQVRLDGALEVDTTSPTFAGNIPAGLDYTARLSSLYARYDNFQTQQRFDDAYLCDLGGTRNNDFLGDLSVNHLVPTTGGVPSTGNNAWALQAGSSKNAAVRENPPDADVTYLNTQTVGAVQTFLFPNMKANSIAVPGLVVTANLRKDDIGARKVDALVKVGANSFQTPTGDTAQRGVGVAVGDLYTPTPYGFDGSPDGTTDGASWTAPAVNALEAGVKLTA